MKRWPIVLLILLSGMWPTARVLSAEAPSAEATDTKQQAPAVERLLMQGTEIQGTVEKPHVVYVVPWKDDTGAAEREIPFERSFKEEILAPVDYGRFQRQWGKTPRPSKGGEK